MPYTLVIWTTLLGKIAITWPIPLSRAGLSSHSTLPILSCWQKNGSLPVESTPASLCRTRSLLASCFGASNGCFSAFQSVRCTIPCATFKATSRDCLLRSFLLGLQAYQHQQSRQRCFVLCGCDSSRGNWRMVATQPDGPRRSATAALGQDEGLRGSYRAWQTFSELRLTEKLRKAIVTAEEAGTSPTRR